MSTETGTAIAAQPTDLGSATPGWLREAARLATEYGLDELGAALAALSADRGRQALRLAVVGEPGKGKSTLVNRLLGRDLLPAGAAAFRGTVVVGAGSDEALVVAGAGGSAGQRPIGAWGELPPGGTAALTVRDDWLAGLRVELVDTPGLGSAENEADGLGRLRRTIAASDGALFVVSAMAPLSITELDLLRVEVLGRHLPFVALVVTMVDLVDPAERDELLSHVANRLATVPGQVTTILGPGPDGGEDELARLRALIEHQALLTDRVLARNRRTAAQVADHCVTMAARATEAMVAQRLADAEYETGVARALAGLETQAQDWETLRLKLTARQLAVTARVRQRVQQDRASLVEKLRADLEHTQDPKAWWERSLPHQLRTELAMLARHAERLILAGLTEDAAWLDGEVLRRYPAAQASRPPAELGLDIVPEPPGQPGGGQLSNLALTRIVTRLSAQGGAIIGYLVAGGRATSTPIFGVGFSVLGGLLAEAYIRAATERQRREIDLELVRVVDGSTMAFVEQLSTVVDDAYAQILGQLAANHLSWHQAGLAAIDPGAHEGAARGPDWAALARASTALAAAIRSALQASGPQCIGEPR